MSSTYLTAGGRLLTAGGNLLVVQSQYSAYQAWSTSQLLASNALWPAALCQKLAITSNTFEFWAIPNANTANINYLYVTDPDDTNNRFHSHFPLGANGGFYFSCGNVNGGGQTPPLYLPTGPEWYNVPHHIAVVVNAQAGTMSVYRDGELFYQQNSYSLRQPSGHELKFFKDQGPAGNIRAWEYARTQEQIQNSITRLINSPEPGLLLNCWCDERGPAGTVIRDRSGNAYHATTY